MKFKSGWKYYYESRFDTFVELKWPYIDDDGYKAQPESLASAGFYFNPSGEHPDNVKCAYCDKELGEWTKNDDPFQVHYEHSQACIWAKVHCRQRVCMNEGEKFIGWKTKKVAEKIALAGYINDIESRLMTFADHWTQMGRNKWRLSPVKLNTKSDPSRNHEKNGMEKAILNGQRVYRKPPLPSFKKGKLENAHKPSSQPPMNFTPQKNTGSQPSTQFGSYTNNNTSNNHQTGQELVDSRKPGFRIAFKNPKKTNTLNLQSPALEDVEMEDVMPTQPNDVNNKNAVAGNNTISPYPAPHYPHSEIYSDEQLNMTVEEYIRSLHLENLNSLEAESKRKIDHLRSLAKQLRSDLGSL
ncbi:Protein bir1 [Zancudomyces culisetae]|uniref:Protein bir1 n=1 Tax=Zancudomyces culisetae TaxID=1213189 RepID=A0A1R1PWC6_ZANCU|nr:Protein bir1 [Zancudomyces culisetae]|eukprot:OMH85271.1 Protein bir1 [Zancudomyces culisetae]